MPIPRHIGTANRIGATAQALLARGDWSGRVLAVVSDAAFLISSDDNVLWLAQDKTPLHPRALWGLFNLRALRPAMRFWQQDATLRFATIEADESPGLCLECVNASVWRPAILLASQVASPEAIYARVLELLAALSPPEDGDSLGHLLPLLRQMAHGDKLTLVSSPSPFIRAAATLFVETAGACRDRDMARLFRSARALVGLGPGLTPGGDDYIGGLFFIAQHLSTAYPGKWQLESTRLGDWLAWARTQTNAISYTLLSDHARGEGVQPLHELVAALLSNRPIEEIMRPIQAILAVGSTTGWDMLIGALTAMLLIAE